MWRPLLIKASLPELMGTTICGAPSGPRGSGACGGRGVPCGWAVNKGAAQARLRDPAQATLVALNARMLCPPGAPQTVTCEHATHAATSSVPSHMNMHPQHKQRLRLSLASGCSRASNTILCALRNARRAKQGLNPTKCWTTDNGTSTSSAGAQQLKPFKRHLGASTPAPQPEVAPVAKRHLRPSASKSCELPGRPTVRRP